MKRRRKQRRPQIRPHPFVEHPHEVDPVLGTQFCWRCHLPAGNRVHEVRERTDEDRAVEARRVGERE